MNAQRLEQVPQTVTGSDPTDDVLLDRVAAGDTAAMKAIYTRHADMVHRFVSLRLKDPFEVADVVQNTMLDVWRTAARFEGRASARSWILSIARNKAVDVVRKGHRTDLSEPDTDLADDAPNPEAIMAATQDAARVRRCVERLKPDHRRAIHLAFYAEMAYPEIAEIEGVPLGTIKTRIHHAKKKLMACLSV